MRRSTSPVAWQGELERWLEPFLERLPRRSQLRWALTYVTGLLLPGERKGVEPMAARLVPGDFQQLHHFVSASPWPERPLERLLLDQALDLVGRGPGTVLAVGCTALLKQGRHSVGVERQPVDPSGRMANCQTLVSLALVRGEVPVCIGLRLYMPEAWFGDRERLARAGAPEGLTYQPRWRIALDEVDRALAGGAGGLRCVLLADPGHGGEARLRQALARRGLPFVAAVPPSQAVMVPTSPDDRSPTVTTAAELVAALPRTAFRALSWHSAADGPLKAAFAATRVLALDESPERADAVAPGCWLVGDRWASVGERHYYLSNLPPDTPIAAFAACIKAGWVVERMHRRMREQLGLDHFGGRSWRGLHHHLLLCQLAFAFLQRQRLRPARTLPEGPGASQPPPTRPARGRRGAAP